jgi:hypothetical protein
MPIPRGIVALLQIVALRIDASARSEAGIEGNARIDVSPRFLDPTQMRAGGDEKEMLRA